MIWRGRSEISNGPGEAAGEAHQPEDASPVDPEGEPSAGTPSVGNRIESVLDAAERAAIGIREDAEDWARHYAEEARRRADQMAADRVQEISALTDSLVNRARAVADQSDELIAALDDAGRRVIGRPMEEDPAGASGANGPAPGPEALPRQPFVPAPDPPSLRAEPASAPPGGPAPPDPASAPPDPVARPTPPAPAAPEPRPRQPEPQAPSQAPPASPVRQGSAVSEGARLLATQMAVAGSTRDEIAWRLREEFGIEDATAILDEIGI